MTMIDYGTTTTPVTESRAVPRFSTSIRVQSQHLPDYFATTLDLAQNGMQLQTMAPLEVGSEVEFCLHLSSLEKLEGVGRVRWTSRSKPYRVGIEFIYLEVDNDRKLERFLRHKLEETLETPPASSAPLDGEYVESEFDINAVLVDAVESEKSLILTLVDEDEPVRWNFPRPSRVEGEIQQDRIEKVLVRPGSSERFEFHFLGPGLRPIIRFRSNMPYRA